MLNRTMPFGNDNIRTSHLKCDRCKTRTSLQGIVRSPEVETRLFGCARCGAVKTIQLATSDVIAASS